MKVVNTPPTDGELELLQILWEKGPNTVRSLNQLMSSRRSVGYTTTLKLLQIMLEKRLVTREKFGKSHVYSAAVAKDTTQKQIVNRMVNSVFKGSSLNLVMQALGTGKTSAEELKQIRKYLSELEKADKNSKKD